MTSVGPTALQGCLACLKLRPKARKKGSSEGDNSPGAPNEEQVGGEAGDEEHKTCKGTGGSGRQGGLWKTVVPRTPDC